jgi:hypothetical protein
MPTRKGTVNTRAGLPGIVEDPVFVDAGYVMPRVIEGAVWDSGQGVTAVVDIEIVDKRAIARRVEIDSTEGVSSTTLRKIPVRDVVATACLNELWKVGPDDGGAFAISKPGRADADEVRRIVQALVGYNPDTDREGVRR